MEALVKYIYEHNNLQNEIINSNEQAITALYHLFIHHGYSLEFLLKNLFSKGFTNSGIYFFRKNTIEFSLISDFFKIKSGNFDLLCQKICEFAHKENVSKLYKKDTRQHNKKIKLIKSKLIEIIEELLSSSMSDTLIDFCSHICILLNDFFKDGIDPYFGEKLICSFIFFNILNPKIIKFANDTQMPHITPLLKIFSEIALNDNNKYPNEHEKIRNIIARILMKRKNSNYIYQKSLSENEYIKNVNIVIAELHKNKLDYEIDRIKNSSENDNKTKLEKMIIKKGELRHTATKKIITITRSESFEKILNNVEILPKYYSLRSDIRYFILWSHDDVLSLATMEKLDLIFLKKWQIDGKNFLRLTPQILCEMGMTDLEEIKKIMKCIENIRNLSIYSIEQLNEHVISWNYKDLCIWLILNNMEHLVDTFIKHDINGDKLIKMDYDSYLKFGIKKPVDISALEMLKKKNLII